MRLNLLYPTASVLSPRRVPLPPVVLAEHGAAEPGRDAGLVLEPAAGARQGHRVDLVLPLGALLRRVLVQGKLLEGADLVEDGWVG